MTRSKRAALWIAAIISILMLSAWLFQRPIGMWLFERAVERAATRDTLEALPDGLHVGLCGTGSPLPNRERAAACTVVIAGKAMFVVDAGEGAARNIAQMGLPNARIKAMFLTHYHSDHIDGMGPMMLLRWTASGNTAPLPVYGPVGVEDVIAGFNAAYALDNIFRTEHHGVEITPPAAAGAIAMPFEVPTTPTVVYEADGLLVTAFAVDHRPVQPSVGYRFDYKGRSVVISGDTAPSKTLEVAAKGADLLIHEALQPRMVEQLAAALDKSGRKQTARIMRDIIDYHASPAQAADSAKTAGVKMLVLSHVVPPMPSSYLNAAFLDGAEDHFDGPVLVGEDGQYFSLPAGGNAIDRGSWF
ncbi:MAG: MBL fold metallo-hydrolase [Sphingopyxis sp.]|uniref:MBL fold metallo-hydrolase n=1 Tax=Sphingopyxis sp. TaxID=1908224 RepID=UPI001A1BDF46|nr:MBL fold metallo-hydrolase [Sphingopyxis sp.]MBJ7500107.1 MBL fold metallo-hydrolase [Sphingopyxis sp.]